jgi:hypothetical protein
MLGVFASIGKLTHNGPRASVPALDVTLRCQVYHACMLTVQQVAERVCLAARTVRYYDRIGLVGASRRSAAGSSATRTSSGGSSRSRGTTSSAS